MSPEVLGGRLAVNREQIQHFNAAALQCLHYRFMAGPQRVTAVRVDEHWKDDDQEAFVCQPLAVADLLNGVPRQFQAASILRRIVKVEIELQRSTLDFARLPRPQSDIEC